LGGTGNTSQLHIAQKMERLAYKYNVELNAENQHIFERLNSGATDDRGAVSPPERERTRYMLKKV
jgi:hypothetical protein